jgi:hypothetical protein
LTAQVLLKIRIKDALKGLIQSGSGPKKAVFIHSGVTRLVYTKIAQYVAQLLFWQNKFIAFSQKKKYTVKILATSEIFKITAQRK